MVLPLNATCVAQAFAPGPEVHVLETGLLNAFVLL